ncbi:archease [Candidatus Woesearchaeota archaeon]|nr:archease [Candidatus Woesearchaeota archaeon]
MKKGFRVLEGIAMADLAFEAVGKDLSELFEHAALAVESAMVDVKTVKPKETTTITLEKDSVETLLYEFLSELVYVKDAEQMLFSEFKVSVAKNKGWQLHAHLKGDTINKKMKLGTDVKAITLHQFSVTQDKKGWTARVVVDV